MIHNFRKQIFITGRCKDCINKCELYNDGWNIPDDCLLEKVTEEEYEKYKL